MVEHAAKREIGIADMPERQFYSASRRKGPYQVYLILSLALSDLLMIAVGFVLGYYIRCGVSLFPYE